MACVVCIFGKLDWQNSEASQDVLEEYKVKRSKYTAESDKTMKVAVQYADAKDTGKIHERIRKSEVRSLA